MEVMKKKARLNRSKAILRGNQSTGRTGFRGVRVQESKAIISGSRGGLLRDA